MREMVPFSERRHRLHPEEVPEVIEALAMLLKARVESGEDLERSIIAFRAFYRLVEHRTGRPNYPKTTSWNVIAEWLKWYHYRGGG